MFDLPIIVDDVIKKYKQNQMQIIYFETKLVFIWNHAQLKIMKINK